MDKTEVKTEVKKEKKIKCVVCKKKFVWRKKWRRDWGRVKFCSERCRRSTGGTS